LFSSQSLEGHPLKVEDPAVQANASTDSYADYLEQLRKSIVRGRAPKREQLPQHLDSAGYWKKAFEKAEAEKTALLEKLHFYEKQKAATTLLSSPSVCSPRTRNGKRRRDETPATQANSTSKRRANSSRTSKSPARNDIHNEYGKELMGAQLLGMLRLPELFTTADLKPDGTTRLLQNFFTLRLHLRSQPPALSAVYASARQLCHTILATVRSFDGNFKPSRNRKHGHAEIWAAIRRTYGTLLEAVHLLKADSSSPEKPKTLISELAKVFDELLNHLQSIAVHEQVCHAANNYRIILIHLQPQRRGLRKRSHPRDVDTPIQGITNLISGMILDLDPAKAAQRELFDGLLCTFLDHLGSNLSLAVFSDSMNEGVPSPVGLLPPWGLPTRSDDQNPSNISTTLKVAPHLINILRKIKPRIGGRGSMDNNDYARAVVDKMQNTLLRALFGEGDQAFRDSLCRPVEVEETYETEDLEINMEEDNTAEWFIGEVWNYVGWDILTKHIT
jgi:hypothetical protein